MLMAQQQLTSARNKHIDIRYHFIRERLESKELYLEYVTSVENLADMLTKPLGSHSFHRLCREWVLNYDVI